MNFGQAIELGFRRYAEFQGRSSRQEYWYWTLFYFLLSLVLGVLDSAVFSHGYAEPGPFGAIATIVMILPSIAISVRRLHDINRSGWWMLLVFVPLIGLIVLFVWFCTRGDAGSNRFGEDPLLHVGPAVYATR